MMHALVVAIWGAALAADVDVNEAVNFGPTNIPLPSSLNGQLTASFSAALLFRLHSDTCNFTASMDTGTVRIRYKRNSWPSLDKTGAIKLLPASIKVINSTRVEVSID